MPIPKESLGDLLSSSTSRNSGSTTLKTPQAKDELELQKPSELKPALRIKAAYRVNDVCPLDTVSTGRSRFHRPLVLGSSIAMSALIVGAAIYLFLFATATDPYVSASEVLPRRQGERVKTPPKITIPFEFGPAKSFAATSDEPVVLPTVADSRRSRAILTRAAYTSQQSTVRRSRRPRLKITNFVPTTLIIYAENGKIKTRIEPQLTAAYKKQPSFPN